MAVTDSQSFMCLGTWESANICSAHWGYSATLGHPWLLRGWGDQDLHSLWCVTSWLRTVSWFTGDLPPSLVVSIFIRAILNIFSGGLLHLVRDVTEWRIPRSLGQGFTHSLASHERVCDHWTYWWRPLLVGVLTDAPHSHQAGSWDYSSARLAQDVELPVGLHTPCIPQRGWATKGDALGSSAWISCAAGMAACAAGVAPCTGQQTKGHRLQMRHLCCPVEGPDHKGPS